MKLKEDIKNALIIIDGFIESSNIIEDIIFWKKNKKICRKVMIPKQKAKQLINKHFGFEFNGYGEPEVRFDLYKIKIHALISIDEILSIRKLKDIESQNYWQEVKKEIELM